MEKAIQTLVTTFLSSARGDNMSSSAFQKMVKNKLGGLMEDTNSSSAVKEMQRGLDENNDGKVSFQEYMTLIGYLANNVSQRQSGECNQGTS